MTKLRIITADKRLAQNRGIKGVITGPSGIGKTSLAWTLDADATLFLNAEAGDLSLQGWQGDMIDVRTWDQARAHHRERADQRPAFLRSAFGGYS